MTGRVYIANETDRMTMTGILVKNRYKVSGGSRQRPGAKTYDYYLDFELGTKKDADDKLYISSEEDQIEAAKILVKNKYTVWSYNQDKNGLREYFYLGFKPNEDNRAVFPGLKKGGAE